MPDAKEGDAGVPGDSATDTSSGNTNVDKGRPRMRDVLDAEDLSSYASDFEAGYDFPTQNLQIATAAVPVDDDILEHCTPEELVESSKKLQGLAPQPINIIGCSSTSNIRLIDPVSTIENCSRFSASVGSTLKLKVLQQRPSQQVFHKPLFELAEMSEKYEKMEQDMFELYTEASSLPYLDLTAVKPGTYAVIRTTKYDERKTTDGNCDKIGENKFIFRRIKFLSGCLQPQIPLYKVEYIDYFFQTMIDRRSNVLVLHASCATLPPRVCAIEMEGISYYKDVFMRKFTTYNSDEFPFEGLLTAEVQPSGQVLVWSDQFPKNKFPYGINGVIIEATWTVIGGRPRLPGEGFHRDDGFVVHVTAAAELHIQFDSCVAKHYIDVFSRIDKRDIEFLRKSVRSPNEDEVYVALHESGEYFRAMINGASNLKTIPQPSWTDMDKKMEFTEEVCVNFIDYGDKSIVKVADLVKAEQLHYLLPRFPKLCMKAHLENYMSLDSDIYFTKFHADDQPYVVHVVKNATEDAPAEVILKTVSNDGKVTMVNQAIVGKSWAEQIVPFFDYNRYEDQGEDLTGTFTASKYLSLGNASRLRVGDTLDVLIKYDRKMPGCRFFMIPTKRWNAWEQFTIKIDVLEEEILKVRREKCWFARKLRPDSGRLPDVSVLVFSYRLRKLARGILLQKHKKKKMFLPARDDGSRNEPQGKVELVNIRWDVYLLDYGIVERIDVLGLVEPTPEFGKHAAFGILAKHEDLETKEKVKQWWDTLVDSRNKGQPNQKNKDEYNHSDTIERKIKVASIKRGKYGEVALVEWCDHKASETDGRR